MFGTDQLITSSSEPVSHAILYIIQYRIGPSSACTVLSTKGISFTKGLVSPPGQGPRHNYIISTLHCDLISPVTLILSQEFHHKLNRMAEYFQSYSAIGLWEIAFHSFLSKLTEREV